MAIEDLKKRFQRFRQNYLDTPEGRQHRQNQLQEQKDVQAVYQSLRASQQNGEDVTDEVLKRLLPYADTKGNRERGNRISTWPCITKDVRTWFEGAKWKTSSEWPEVAKWLLEIVEAGQRADWVRWNKLANQSTRKGFACGFITPIVHCLNPALPVINSKVVDTYKSVMHELGTEGELSLALAGYPQSQQMLLDLVKRLATLGISDLLEWDIYCHWNISKRLGGGKDTLLPPLTVAIPAQQPGASQIEETIQTICDELQKAQHDTTNPTRFERAVANAFRFLGFQAEHIGGSGETDVSAHALLGDESFSLVIDAKTCQPGSVKSGIDYDTLRDHQEQHTADYVIVVAPSFAGGKTIKHAETQGVGLLETRQLILLVEEAEKSGISLYHLKEIFKQSGPLALRFETYAQPRSDMIKAMREVLEIFETHQRGDESSSSLDVHSVFWMLKGKGSKYPLQYIENAVLLLANPLVYIIEKKDTGYVLTIPVSRAFVRLQSLGEALSTIVSDS